MEVQALKRQLYIAMKRHEASLTASWRFIAASTAASTQKLPLIAQRGRHKSEQICIVTSPKSKRIKCIAISDVCHLYLTQLDKAFALWTKKLVEGHLMCSKRAVHKALACFVCVLLLCLSHCMV